MFAKLWLYGWSILAILIISIFLLFAIPILFGIFSYEVVLSDPKPGKMKSRKILKMIVHLIGWFWNPVHRFANIFRRKKKC